MLVVGDANAQGLATLHEHVDVTIVARPGSSWQNVGKDVETFISKGVHNFHMVLAVLGSNEIPRAKAQNKTWDKALRGIKEGLAGLRECLMVGQPASHVLSPIPGRA